MTAAERRKLQRYARDVDPDWNPEYTMIQVEAMISILKGGDDMAKKKTSKKTAKKAAKKTSKKK